MTKEAKARQAKLNSMRKEGVYESKKLTLSKKKAGTWQSKNTSMDNHRACRKPVDHS